MLVADDLASPDDEVFAVLLDGRVVGAVQWYAENEPDFRHAGIDVYLDPAVHGRGVGTDAVRTLARYLIHEPGYHRLVIDPAADNLPAIRCYSKVGFRPVGVMRQYWRNPVGQWCDGLLMDLLAAEIGVLLLGALYFGKSSFFPNLPGLTGNADGHGDGLKDITISWDDSYAARYGH